MRSIVTSNRALEFAVAAASACALALAFPKFNAAWLAPVGAAGLFWLWQRLSWKRAFFTGWFAGAIFFCISFAWFGYTVGSFVGKLALAIVIVPAIVEGLFFGCAAALASVAFARMPRAAAPLGAAAAFTIFEWLRSIGVLGVPFAQLGYTQAGTPLAVFAAYIGTFGVTLVICIIGAYVAQAIAIRNNRILLATLGCILAAWFACWFAWPARHAAAPTVRVAAVQGNISQSIKWDKKSLPHAVARYTALTQQVAAFHPQLVVWPETVMTTDLTDNVQLSAQLAQLARSLNATLATGTIDVHNGQVYNASFVYGPTGALSGIYDKRQMVPFAEAFPGKAFLRWLPYTDLISDFGTGHIDGVYAAGDLRFAPLICWESAFADLAHAQLRDGANLLVISTDDAWFGETSGPYQHAQIAQMRAIEAGTWIVRAASTGISGIIAPDGKYVQHTDLDREAVVLGLVGAPPGSIFATVGPTPVMIALTLLYLILLFAGRRAPR